MVAWISLLGLLISLNMATRVLRWISVKTIRGFFGVLWTALPFPRFADEDDDVGTVVSGMGDMGSLGMNGDWLLDEADVDDEEEEEEEEEEDVDDAGDCREIIDEPKKPWK